MPFGRADGDGYGDHLDALAWLRSQSPWNALVCASAARHGQVDALAVMLEGRAGAHGRGEGVAPARVGVVGRAEHAEHAVPVGREDVRGARLRGADGRAAMATRAGGRRTAGPAPRRPRLPTPLEGVERGLRVRGRTSARRASGCGGRALALVVWGAVCAPVAFLSFVIFLWFKCWNLLPYSYEQNVTAHFSTLGARRKGPRTRGCCPILFLHVQSFDRSIVHWSIWGSNYACTKRKVRCLQRPASNWL